MKQLKLQSLASEKSVFLRIIAQSVATLANETFESLRDIKDNKIEEHFAAPDHHKWLKFYLRHRYLQTQFLPSFFQLGDMPSIHAQIYTHLAKAPVDPTIENETVGKNLLSPEEVFDIHIESIKEDIQNKPFSNEKKLHVKKLIVTPEFLFLMKIAVPSWLLFKDDHVHIYRRARLGDMKSLDKLLRLDKMHIMNPYINKWIYRNYAKNDKRKFEYLIEAVRNPPRQKITLQKVKYLLAGYISYVSEVLNDRLTAPEIQSLFDAVAVDYGRDDLRDQDLPASPEAFYKAVKRESDFWKAAFPSTRTK